MGLFSTNMADYQLGLAMDDKAGGDSRCINCGLDAVDATPARESGLTG